jgi:hypothetical protein
MDEYMTGMRKEERKEGRKEGNLQRKKACEYQE